MMIYAALVLMSFTAAAASLFFKKASTGGGLTKLLVDKNFYIGGFLYGAAALLNLYILRYLDYSVVMPMGSVTYIWTMLLSFFFLGEKISREKVLGVLCIIVGAVCVATP